MNRIKQLFVAALFLPFLSVGQQLGPVEKYLKINAGAEDPLYTVYAASMQRSTPSADHVYFLDYFSNSRPHTYIDNHPGKLFCVWKIDGVVIGKTSSYFQQPVILYSFPDMAVVEYSPARGLQVRETFLVYSSSWAMVDLEVRNTGTVPREVDFFPVLEVPGDTMHLVRYDSVQNAVIALIRDPLAGRDGRIYPVENLFAASEVESWGACQGNPETVYSGTGTPFSFAKEHENLNQYRSENPSFISLHLKKRLRSGEKATFRYLRGCQGMEMPSEEWTASLVFLKSTMMRTFFDDNLLLYSWVPRPHFQDFSDKLLFISALNLSRNSFFPASGSTRFNFFTQSRNFPGKNGGGMQSLEDAIALPGYAGFDKASAMACLRGFMENQDSSGFMPHSSGPDGALRRSDNGSLIAAPPLFSWLSIEVFEVTGDRLFLADAYGSAGRFFRWMQRNRDRDGDGLFSWGEDPAAENLRHTGNPVFEVSATHYLSSNRTDISGQLECADLTFMMIHEARCLARMALVLGLTGEAAAWKKIADETSEKANRVFWNEERGFYFSVDSATHGFTHLDRDLRHDDLSAFLALWAEAAPRDRADRLVSALSDSSRFGRLNGIPSLSASDPFYSPSVDQGCKWNGPIHLQWNYMIYQGLKMYGYTEQAQQLADRMKRVLKEQLSVDHDFPESYSPDYEAVNTYTGYFPNAVILKLFLSGSGK